jgi:nucleoside-diphosphate-sugar epimerase
VVNLLTARAVVDGEITLIGGEQWRPFIHVDDAARAILGILEAPLSLVHTQVFNVGSDEQNYTIRQIAEIVGRLVSGARLVELDGKGDLRNYRVNFDKIRRTLDYAPRWTVEQGIQQVIDSIQSGQVKDYRDAKYSNVRYLDSEGMLRLLRRENGWSYQVIDPSGVTYGIL